MYKLLIVDDEPMTRDYIKAHVNGLHRDWICAGEAGDGQEALELIDRGDSFDLIITDIKMPVMTGLELARELAGRRDRSRVVILSGYDEFALAKEAMHYGVTEYMLKPLVKDELVAVLGRMASELAAERADQAAYQSLTEQSREQVARNFLHAVVTDNNMEIKVLYPLLHRLKINLLEAEGAILLIDLDEGQLLERGISPSDQALFRYIVHQTAAELIGADSGVVLFVDHEQRTALFVPGDDGTDVRSRCAKLYENLSKAMVGMTGLGLWGAVGSAEMDVLQLGVSYRGAGEAMQRRWLAEECQLFEGGTMNADPGEIDKLAACAEAFRSALAVRRELQAQAALSAFAALAGTATRRSTLRRGVYLLRALGGLLPAERRAAMLHSAAQALRQEALAESFGVEDAARLYAKAIRVLLANLGPDSPDAPTASGTSGAFGASGASGGVSEHETVTRVKAYIHAHFAEPLSLALIADKMGVSPGYLSSLFHQNTQESYIKFLTRVRMEHAAQLLRAKPPEKVYDVAEKVGYLSVKHFSYVFKQHFGTPPGEYQERALR